MEDQSTTSVTHLHTCEGTCSKAIEVTTHDGIIENVTFFGGCNGNTKGISKLVKGMKATDVIALLKGTQCGNRGTSCPDQLARALEKIVPPLKGGLGAGLFILIFFLFTACTESFSDRCRREAREFTERQCPRLIANFIVLDSMTYAEEPQGFTYHYRLQGEWDDPELLTPDILEEFVQNVGKSLREDITLKTYKERGLHFTYRYVSASTGQLYTEATFGPEDY